MRGSIEGARLRMLAVGMCMFLTGSGTSAAGPQEQYPNVVPAPPYEVQLGPADDSSPFEPRVALRFSVAIANRTKYPFDVLGVMNGAATADAQECVSWSEDTHSELAVCLERASIGNISYHNEHRHWHLERFVTYELRAVLPDGMPDMSAGGLVGESRKISFCLLNSAHDTEPPPQGTPEYSLNTYSLCSLGSMGISPGFRDEYSHDLADQQLQIDGVPDGEYAIVVTANPDGRIFETTRLDNVSFTRIRLQGETVTTLAVG